MVSVEVKGKKYTIDGILYRNLELCKELIKQDIDYVFIIDGPVGSGKSVFAQQLAHFVSDGDFGIDDVVFTPKDFVDRVRTREQYKAVVWDECFRGLASTSSMSRINREITELLLECRDRNLFIFLVTPNFWDIQKKTIRDRAKGVIHCKMSIDREKMKVIRGGYAYFSKEKLIPFMENVKNKNFHPKRSSFYGEWRWAWRELNELNEWKLAPKYLDKYRYMVGSQSYLAKKRSTLGNSSSLGEKDITNT